MINWCVPYIKVENQKKKRKTIKDELNKLHILKTKQKGHVCVHNIVKGHPFSCIWAFQISQGSFYQSGDIKSSPHHHPKPFILLNFISAIIDQCPNSSKATEQANDRILKLE